MRSFLSSELIASPAFAEFYSYQVINRKLNELAILQKSTDGQLRTAAIVDPEGNNAQPRVTPDAVRRIDGGEAMVINASANKIEAVTPIDRASGVYLYTARSSDLLAFSQGGAPRTSSRPTKVHAPRPRAATALQRRAFRGLSGAGRAGGVVRATLCGPAGEAALPACRCGAARRQRQLLAAARRALRVRRDRPAQPRLQPHDRADRKADPGIDERQPAIAGRAFIEAVLELVTAGIISLDGQGRVLLMNSTAQRLLFDSNDQDRWASTAISRRRSPA